MKILKIQRLAVACVSSHANLAWKLAASLKKFSIDMLLFTGFIPHISHGVVCF